MIELEASYLIRDVTPEQCFAYLADLDNATEWNSFITAAESDEAVALGTEVRARISFIISFGVTATVTQFDRPDAYALSASKPLKADIGGRFAEAADGTSFTYFYRMPPTKFFPVPSMVLKRLIKVQFDKDGEQMRSCLQGLSA